MQNLFILEQPYVSNLILETLEKNNFLVLKNNISEKYTQKLNLISTEEISDIENYTIYSNSENSIDWVNNNFKNSTINKNIETCKNKYLMRKKLQTIYPDFYFKETSIEEIGNIKTTDLPEKFIIKPSIGFLSMGVHKINSINEWEDIKKTIKKESKNFIKNFPQSVVNSSKFIIEELIEGDEYAIDAYYNKNNEITILNIFQHPFADEDDVSDRTYISSEKIIKQNLLQFENILNKIGKQLNLKNFPIHIEVIKTKNGEIIPVEINPMRFAGWCTTDLAYYAYGINIYEYFVEQKRPDWNKILKNKKNKIFYFAIAETPKNIDKTEIRFDYESLKKEFSNILEFRKIDFKTKPVFAIIFGETTNMNEITEILKFDINKFITY